MINSVSFVLDQEYRECLIWANNSKKFGVLLQNLVLCVQHFVEKIRRFCYLYC